MSEIPQKLYYMGKDIEAMSREELIEVVREQFERDKALMADLKDQRERHVSLMKDIGRALR